MVSASDDPEPNLIVDHVFLGSKAHAKDRKLLERLQITHILNVTPLKTTDPIAGVPNFFEKDKTLTYRRCPLFDNKAEDITLYLEGCVAFIEQARFYGRILVHCNKGVSRSVSIVLAYLIKVHGFSAKEALDFVKARRSVANPNESFLRQLRSYETRLLHEKRENVKARSKDSERAARGVIGPQLPPHLMKASGEQKDFVEPMNSITSPQSDNCSGAFQESAKRQRDEQPEKAVGSIQQGRSVGGVSPASSTKRIRRAVDRAPK